MVLSKIVQDLAYAELREFEVSVSQILLDSALTRKSPLQAKVFYISIFHEQRRELSCIEF